LGLALLAPFVPLGCGGSRDGDHVQIGDATKSEVKARAEAYRARALLKKKKAAPKR